VPAALGARLGPITFTASRAAFLRASDSAVLLSQRRNCLDFRRVDLSQVRDREPLNVLTASLGRLIGAEMINFQFRPKAYAGLRQ
jgi:hypothetical protein